MDIDRAIAASSKLNFNISEAAGDYPRRAFYTEKFTSDVMNVVQASGYKTLTKWAAAKMAKDSTHSVVCAVTNKKMLTEIKGHVIGKLDSTFENGDGSLQLIFPKQSEELQGACKDFQIKCSEDFHSIAVTTFCFGEVLACSDASLYTAGVPWGSVPGENMPARSCALGKMDCAGFGKLASDSGFFVHAAKGSVVCITPGMLVLMAAAERGASTSLVRWGVLAKSEIATAKTCLTEMLQSYPFLTTSDYSALLKLCEASES